MKTDDPPSTMAIIPVYKDIARLLKVLNKFEDELVDEICIVVDGASRDQLKAMEQAASEMRTPVYIIEHEVREGVGNAIKKGIEYALEEEYDIAVVMAGNNKDDPREIPRLLKPLVEEDYDYVQGSRFLPGGKRVKNPFLRGVFSRLYPFIWTLLTTVRCTDVTNGFRAYKLKIFSHDGINIWQDWLDEYQLEYYIHYKALTLGFKTTEVPVSKIYPYSHKGGYSNISVFRDWWKIAGPLIYLKLGIKS